MKKIWMLMAFALLLAATGSAKNTDLRLMLKEGKVWYYTYHHFEDSETGYEESTYDVSYILKGDTTIDGRQYMKMYRRDPKDMRYYAAFREDGEGRVWQYDYEGDKKDFMVCDVTCSSYPGAKNMAIPDVINVEGGLLHRYRWNGITGVEGVGIEGKGLVHYVFAPEPDCICDFESFDHMSGDGFFFYNTAFQSPTYIELTKDEQRLVERNNDFAFNLFRKARTEKNMLLSPLSITYALGMLNNGAAGQTQREICDVLGFTDVSAQNEFCLKLTNSLLTAGQVDNTTRMSLSNTIFVNEGMGCYLQDEFTHKVNNYYYAYPQSRNFADGETRQVINLWGSEHTEGMIKEVLSEDEFDVTALSYLLNAIYFKGLWSHPFKAEDTRDETFGGGDAVPMMHQEQLGLVYGENNLYQTVSMPYGNGTYQMQLFLPREGRTMDEVVASLDGKNWQVKGVHYDTDLKLPRFETDTEMDLNDIMSELGMPSAFTPGIAEFPYFCVGQSVYISRMKQVSKIKLDEEGSEAAAITVIETKNTGITPRAKFHANRPFLYVISEQSTGVILFVGQYMGESVSNALTASRHQAVTDCGQGLYNLAGQRISEPPMHGIYIKDGKKMMR